MVKGVKSEKSTQRHSLRLSAAFPKTALSQQKQPGTHTGQLCK